MEIQRYEAVQGLVYQDPGVNRFQVRRRLLSAERHLQACSTCSQPQGNENPPGIVSDAARLY